MKRASGFTVLAIVIAVVGAVAAIVFVGNEPDVPETSAVRVPIDVEVRLTAPPGELDHELGRVADRIRHLTLQGATGLLVAKSAPATLQTNSGPASTCVVELDLREARRFGEDPAATGFEGVDAPGENGVVLSAAVAATIDVRTGGEITAAIGTRRQRFAVDDVVAPDGLAGYCGAVVPPGTVGAMAGDATGPRAPTGLVWIALDAATRRDAVAVDAVVSAIEAEVGAPGVEVSRYHGP